MKKGKEKVHDVDNLEASKLFDWLAEAMATDCSQDYLLALRLEAEFALEDANSEVASLIPPEFRKGSPLKRPSASDDPFSSPQPSTSRGLPGTNTMLNVKYLI